jgi:predicted enzyme related to lactoylglutathione lyase/chloramphenicol 3-O-phosphotransferase
MTEQRVLIITGPIASGKSTLAQALAAESRGSGSRAAVVDLDPMYAMLHDGPLMSDPLIARLARRAAAALVDQYIVDGIQLVIVVGDFWTSGQRDEFTQRLSSGVALVFVTLGVSVEEAFRRVELDSNRRLSRIPEALRQSHADFAASPRITGDVIIDSSVLSVAEVAARIRSVLDTPTSSSGAGHRFLFTDIDCLQIPVPDLEAGLAFYRDALGHQLIWRTDTAAGLRLANDAAELVVQTERPELEANLSVESADAAARAFVAAGGTLMVAPFDIAIGRCAVVHDRWGNRLVLLDHRKGRLLTDATGRVRIDQADTPQRQASPDCQPYAP